MIKNTFSVNVWSALFCVAFSSSMKRFTATQPYMREFHLNREKSMKLFWNFDDYEINFEVGLHHRFLNEFTHKVGN